MKSAAPAAATRRCASRMLDIDNFKKINDTYGHDDRRPGAGASGPGGAARRCGRRTPSPAIGGEEFVIILTDTRLDDAMQAMVRVQRELTRKFFLHNNEKLLITFSCGVAELGGEEDARRCHQARRPGHVSGQAGRKKPGYGRVIGRPRLLATPRQLLQTTGWPSVWRVCCCCPDGVVMKCVILAGGFGTRISEESHLKPKPMIEVGGKPIIWHIMKIYSAHGIDDFVICLGYKGYVIKEYFANYFLHTSDVTFDMRANQMEVHERHAEPWRVTLVDTGEQTMTGGRLKRVAPYVRDEEQFCFTYGDGVVRRGYRATCSRFHREHGKLATALAVQPPGRFGALDWRTGLRAQLRRETHGRRWLDQRRFLRAVAALSRFHRRRPTVVGDRATDPAGRTRPIGGLPAHGFLAADGHPARSLCISRSYGKAVRLHGNAGNETSACRPVHAA